MTYETKFGRNMRDGLEATTIINLGLERRQLRITTGKNSGGGIATNASVVTASEDGRSFSMVIFQDFSKRLSHDRAQRTTEKNIAAMHAKALLTAPALIEEVGAFYVAIEAKKANSELSTIE